MFETSIPVPFLEKAASLLGATGPGLSGPKIVSAINSYAVQWDVMVPHPSYPFEASNKATALLDSLRAFSAPQQFIIIEELCDHPSFAFPGTDRTERQKLKADLFTKFGHLRPEKEASELDLPLVEETRHWLSPYPAALAKLDSAKLKYDAKLFHRNLIDDLRLGLELLLKEILQNSKSLENQLAILGPRLKERGGSPQITNMLVKIIDCYCVYQNDNVKHNDNVPEEEVELIFELTASFMKHLVRVAA